MMTELKKEIEKMNNLGTTENGAIGYKSTGKELLDLNFKVPSMRGGISVDDENKFIQSLHDNLEYTVKWLFFIRDIRGGLGERDTFVRLYEVYFEQYPEVATATLKLISEYGRWKDIVDLAFTGNDQLKSECFKLIETQLKEDVLNCTNGKSISLLAKWLPSINATQTSRVKAMEIMKHLEMYSASYRKMLSKLRKYLDVTEVKTCGNKWGDIDYNKVSSNANLRYSNSFLKHDETRRRRYLEELAKPNSTAKMHTSDLYPHEIWHKYVGHGYYNRNIKKDDALEAMWKNLKEVGGCGNTMCVCDGSGSMSCSIPNSSAMALDVSRSLSVYFAERCTGEFHNKFIEFSSEPQFIDLDGKSSLVDKINHVQKYNDCSNTDIEKVFRMILHTAVNHNMKQEDMPDRILIISDMEFDHATVQSYGNSWNWNSRRSSYDFTTLFDTIRADYEAAGYKLPRLVFWNVNSRTNTIPVTENEAGVALISGFSTNLVKMVMSNETDPWVILKETLDSERYKVIGETLNSIKG